MNKQLDKNIVWGINSENQPFGAFGIGELFCFTPLFRYNHNSEMQFLNNEHGRKAASIFKDMAKVSIFDNPKDVHSTVAPYGDESKYTHDRHQVKDYLALFDIKHDNYIPWINLSTSDVLWAKQYLSKYKNPITIAPIAGGFSDNCPSAISRMMIMSEWQRIVNYLVKKGHDIIYLTAPHNFIPLDNTYLESNYDFRQLAAILKVCGVHIGIENGIFHAAIASGARCFSLIPTYGFSGYLHFFSYGYTDDMWIHEPNRAKYYLFNEVDKLLKDLEF